MYNMCTKVCHISKRSALLIAVLDSIGGVLGVFICSLLLGTFWHMSSYPVSNGKHVVSASFDENGVIWSSGLALLHSLANFHMTIHKGNGTSVYYSQYKFRNFVFVYVVLLYLLAVLASMHIIFGPILVLGVLKKKVNYIKIWMAFKIIVVVLTTSVFIVLCWRFTAYTIAIYIVFLTMNAIFLGTITCLISKPLESNLKENVSEDEFEEVGPLVDPALAVSGQKFQLEYALARFGVLDECIKCLERKGLQHEGLYRVENEGFLQHKKVQKIIRSLIANPNLDIRSMELDVNVLASLIKEIVSKRLIPPVISTDQLPQIEQIAQISDSTLRFQKLYEFLSRLPPPNFAALRILFVHLAKIADASESNAMDSKNLALCWWSSLFPYNITDAKARQVDNAIKDLFQAMIDQNQFFFGRPETTV